MPTIKQRQRFGQRSLALTDTENVPLMIMLTGRVPKHKSPSERRLKLFLSHEFPGSTFYQSVSVFFFRKTQTLHLFIRIRTDKVKKKLSARMLTHSKHQHCHTERRQKQWRNTTSEERSVIFVPHHTIFSLNFLAHWSREHARSRCTFDVSKDVYLFRCQYKGRQSRYLEPEVCTFSCGHFKYNSFQSSLIL